MIVRYYQPGVFFGFDHAIMRCDGAHCPEFIFLGKLDPDDDAHVRWAVDHCRSYVGGIGQHDWRVDDDGFALCLFCQREGKTRPPGGKGEQTAGGRLGDRRQDRPKER